MSTLGNLRNGLPPYREMEEWIPYLGDVWISVHVNSQQRNQWLCIALAWMRQPQEQLQSSKLDWKDTSHNNNKTTSIAYKSLETKLRAYNW